MSRPLQPKELTRWIADDPRAWMHIENLILHRFAVDENGNIWVGNSCLGRLS